MPKQEVRHWHQYYTIAVLLEWKPDTRVQNLYRRGLFASESIFHVDFGQGFRRLKAALYSYFFFLNLFHRQPSHL